MKNIALILTVALASFGCSGQQAANAPSGKSAVATPAPSASDGKKSVPDFDLAKIAGGSLKSAELRGKVTVVDFWATWCTQCIPEIPDYNALQDKYAGKDVRILGITMESGSLDEIKPKVAELKMNYPVVMGDDKVVEGFGGLVGYPTTFLIAKDGTIYKRYLGAPPGKKEALEKDIENLLAQPAPPVD